MRVERLSLMYIWAKPELPAMVWQHSIPVLRDMLVEGRRQIVHSILVTPGKVGRVVKLGQAVVRVSAAFGSIATPHDAHRLDLRAGKELRMVPIRVSKAKTDGRGVVGEREHGDRRVVGGSGRLWDWAPYIIILARSLYSTVIAPRHRGYM